MPSTVARSAVPISVAQLRGHRGPGGVAVAAVQIGARQAARHAGDHQRADQTGAVAHPHRQVRHAGGVQIANHARIGDQVVGQHHQVRAGGGDDGVGVAALRDPRTGAAQRIEQQIRQRPAAVDADRQGERGGRAGAVVHHAGGHQRLEQVGERGRVVQPVLAGQPAAVRRRRIGTCSPRSRAASAAEVTPSGGRTSTARRGSQPTCTAPSGRSSTGIAGSSA